MAKFKKGDAVMFKRGCETYGTFVKDSGNGYSVVSVWDSDAGCDEETSVLTSDLSSAE